MCKLRHTELKDNFEEDAAMLQISEIARKPRKCSISSTSIFTIESLPARPSPYPWTEGAAHTAGAVFKATKGMDKLSLITSYAIVANPLAHLPVVS